MAPLRRQCLDETENPGAAKRTAVGSRDQGGGFCRWREHGRIGGGRIGRQKSPGGFELLALRRTPDPIVTDFDHAWWQDMLKETVEEFVSRKSNVADLLRPVVAVAEANLAVIDGLETAVGDSDAEDVAAQIVEDLFTAARMLRVNDPVLLPE